MHMRPASAMPLALIITAGSSSSLSALIVRWTARVNHAIKAERIAVAVFQHEFSDFFVVGFGVQTMDGGGADGERAYRRRSAIHGDFAFIDEPMDAVDEFLGSADSECRNDCFATTLAGAVDDVAQYVVADFIFVMVACAVGAFDDQDIGFIE